MGGGLLYVQPVYALRPSGEGTYPVLRFVLASFGKEAGFGTTLTEALKDVLRNAGNVGDIDLPGDEAGGQQGGSGDGGGPSGPTDPQVLQLLEQADEAFAEAKAALRENDFAAYGEATDRAQRLINRALLLAAASAQESQAQPEE